MVNYHFAFKSNSNELIEAIIKICHLPQTVEQHMQFSFTCMGMAMKRDERNGFGDMAAASRKVLQRFDQPKSTHTGKSRLKFCSPTVMLMFEFSFGSATSTKKK